MAIIGIAPFGLADASGLPVTGGTFSIQSAIVHSAGVDAVRFNEVASTGHVYFEGYAADGSPTFLNTASQRWFGGWLYLNSLPSVKSDIGYFGDSAGGVNSRLHVDTSGNLILNGTADSATIATLSTGVWYWVEHRATPGGTCAARVNGGTEQTVTAKNSNNLYWYRLGNIFTSCTFDFVWADCVIDDAAYPGPCTVQVLVPMTGTSAEQTWTTGTGSTYTEVDDCDGTHANDGDTTYIKDSTSGHSGLFLLTDLSGSPTIKACVPYMIIRDEGGVSSVRLNLRTNATGAHFNTAADPGSSYVYRAGIYAVDPDTSSAWAVSAVNLLQVGPNNQANVAVRCTATGVFVITQLYLPATAASTIPKLTSAATATQISSFTAAAASTIPKLTSAAVAVEAFKAAAASAIPKLTSAAVAVSGALIQAAAASTIPKLTSAAVAREKFTAAAASTIPKLTSSAQAASAYAVAIARSTIPKLLSAAVGRAPFVATAASTIPKLLSAAGVRIPNYGIGPFGGTSSRSPLSIARVLSPILGIGRSQRPILQPGTSRLPRPGEPTE